VVLELNLLSRCLAVLTPEMTIVFIASTPPSAWPSHRLIVGRVHSCLNTNRGEEVPQRMMSETFYANAITCSSQRLAALFILNARPEFCLPPFFRRVRIRFKRTRKAGIFGTSRFREPSVFVPLKMIESPWSSSQLNVTASLIRARSMP